MTPPGRYILIISGGADEIRWDAMPTQVEIPCRAVIEYHYEEMNPTDPGQVGRQMVWNMIKLIVLAQGSSSNYASVNGWGHTISFRTIRFIDEGTEGGGVKRVAGFILEGVSDQIQIS